MRLTCVVAEDGRFKGRDPRRRVRIHADPDEVAAVEIGAVVGYRRGAFHIMGKGIEVGR